jgi:peptide/nickel transport system substrate-binding protein
MTLVANSNYYQGTPKLAQINIKFVPDPETALAALKTGDVDLVPDFAESDIPTLSALEPKQHLRVDTTPTFEHLFFNLGTAAGVNGTGKSDVDGFCPFQDVNVRKAIMLGVDRDTIVKTLLFGKTTVPASLWPNSSWYNTSLTPYPFDIAQANKLLDDAGYPVGADGIRAGTCNGNPVKFSLGVETTTKQVRKDEVLAIQANLKQIGIDIKPNHLPAGTFFGAYSEGADMPLGKFDMAVYTTGFYPDPDPGDSFLCSGVPSKDNPTGQNNYHYCDPAMDKLFADGLASADPAARKIAYDAIQKFQYDNVLFVPLYARANVYGYSDRFVFPPSSGFGGWAWDAYDFAVK